MDEATGFEPRNLTSRARRFFMACSANVILFSSTKHQIKSGILRFDSIRLRTCCCCVYLTRNQDEEIRPKFCIWNIRTQDDWPEESRQLSFPLRIIFIAMLIFDEWLQTSAATRAGHWAGSLSIGVRFFELVGILFEGLRPVRVEAEGVCCFRNEIPALQKYTQNSRTHNQTHRPKLMKTCNASSAVARSLARLHN